MRYSNHARSAIELARQEASRLNHDHISTGHLLLGIIREGESSALSFLKSMRVDLEKIKRELENSMEAKGHGTMIGALKLTTRASKALQLADEESQKMGHKYIGTEHIIIGIILEQDGVAPKILEKAGIGIDKARAFAMSANTDEDESFETLTFDNAKMMIPISEPHLSYSKDNHEVLDLEGACKLLKISLEEINKLLREEDIPARMIGKKWRFSRDALIRWLGEGKSREYSKFQ